MTIDRKSLDLRNQTAVDRWFVEHRPDAVLLAAARVGGIHDNASYPADFLYDNLAIATNVIEASRRSGVAKLMFFGVVLHLSAARAAADARELPVDGAARTNERVVRYSQNSGAQIVSGLSAAISLRLRLGDADKPLWPKRQFRSNVEPRAARLAGQNRGREA